MRGDPDHHVSRGRLCTKCSIAYNGVLRDNAVRLTRPLRRVGPKGSGQFEPVSWAGALGEIAARLDGIVSGHGPATILNAHYTGTCALLGTAFPLRFFHRLGATEIDPDTICNKAGYEALSYLYGDSGDGFDPETACEANCILVWGANPSASAPHQHEHWLAEAPGTVVVVDPVRTPTAAAADLHLQPFPGSDAALAFALAHVLQRDGLVDRNFVDTYTLGFHELEPLLEPCTPRWAEQTTGVPAALIERAAQTYGNGPSLLWLGQGFQRQPRGGNALRAVAMLPAMTGNLGRPGSGWAYVTGSDSRRIDDEYLVAGHLLADPPPPLSQMDLADVLADPTRAQALFCWNINIAASNPRLGDLRRALEREDLLTVVLDLFQTDTADLADYVLPAASFLESDDLVCSYFHHTLSAQVKAADPPGEALPNSEIFRRLSAAIGYTEPELYESDQEVIDELLRRTGFGVSWDDLARSGTVRLYETPRLQFADRSFPTASGRVELASAAAVGCGPSATTRTVARPTPGKRSPASALAGFPLGAQLELRQRPQDRPQTRAADRHAAPRRRSRTRPHRRRPRRPRNRDRTNARPRRRRPARPPRRRLLPQGSLAQTHRRQRQRQHAQPRRPSRHGPLNQRPRHRDHRCSAPCARTLTHQSPYRSVALAEEDREDAKINEGRRG